MLLSLSDSIFSIPCFLNVFIETYMHIITAEKMIE
jgi:hypothetical protein